MQVEQIDLRDAHKEEASMAAKATTTIRQVMHYQPEHAAWFAANQVLFNQVAAFYFEVIQAHENALMWSRVPALKADVATGWSCISKPTIHCGRSHLIFPPNWCAPPVSKPPKR